MLQQQELCRKLSPSWARRSTGCGRVYLAESDADGKADIEQTLELLAAKHLGQNYQPDRSPFPPPARQFAHGRRHPARQRDLWRARSCTRSSCRATVSRSTSCRRQKRFGQDQPDLRPHAGHHGPRHQGPGPGLETWLPGPADRCTPTCGSTPSAGMSRHSDSTP